MKKAYLVSYTMLSKTTMFSKKKRREIRKKWDNFTQDLSESKKNSLCIVRSNGTVLFGIKGSSPKDLKEMEKFLLSNKKTLVGYKLRRL